MKIAKRGVILDVKDDNGSSWLPLYSLLNAGVTVPKLVRERLGIVTMLLSLLGHKNEISKNCNSDVSSIDKAYVQRMMVLTLDKWSSNGVTSRRRYNAKMIIDWYSKILSAAGLSVMIPLLSRRAAFNDVRDELFSKDSRVSNSNYNHAARRMQTTTLSMLSDYFKSTGTVVDINYLSIAVRRGKREANNTNSLIIHGNVLPHLHSQAGYNGYIWKTKQDKRVRPTHAKMHNKRISYSHAHSAKHGFDQGLLSVIYGRLVHPGEEPNCRCSSIPIKLSL